MGKKNDGRAKLHERICKAKFKLPQFLTHEAKSLLKGLMTKEPSKRYPPDTRKLTPMRFFFFFAGLLTYFRLRDRSTGCALQKM